MNVVHKRIFSLISHGGYKKIVCSVSSDDGSGHILNNTVAKGLNDKFDAESERHLC